MMNEELRSDEPLTQPLCAKRKYEEESEEHPIQQQQFMGVSVSTARQSVVIDSVFDDDIHLCFESIGVPCVFEVEVLSSVSSTLLLEYRCVYTDPHVLLLEIEQCASDVYFWFLLRKLEKFGVNARLCWMCIITNFVHLLDDMNVRGPFEMRNRFELLTCNTGDKALKRDNRDRYFCVFLCVMIFIY